MIENTLNYPLKFAKVFHNKEEYLFWVKKWKEEYKPLAERQKEIRKIITQPHTVIKSENWYENNTHMVGEHKVGQLMCEKWENRWRLRWLIEKRLEAKEWAGILRRNQLKKQQETS